MTDVQIRSTTSADGTQIKLYRWNDPGTENIFLVHSYAGHAQKLHALALDLSEKGYRVTALDLRGHGESGGSRGDIDLWLRYTEDILAAISTIRAPFFAIGQGSGALALLHVMQGSITPTLRGAIIANPLLGVLRPPSFLRSLFLRATMRLPFSLRVPHLFRWDQLAFDGETVESYRRDPLCFEKTSLRFVQGLLCAQKSVLRHAQNYGYPLLMLLSPNDSIVDLRSTNDFFHSYSGHREQKKYIKSAHLLLEDQEKEDVFSDIHEWIQSTITQ
jgi:alpha-beta hydrolase superfamily lysophospholipase